jgi:two-component system sensor histidine kinase UhpB
VLIVLGAIIAIDLTLMLRAFAPLRRLTALMRSVDPLAPGRRLPPQGGGSEIEHLTDAFNQMLDRIEGERLDYGRRTVAAQEGERQRLALELHDEIGQTVTAMMLQLKSIERGAAPDLKPAVTTAMESARATVESLHEIVRRLRPEALDDLGLEAAVAALGNRVRAGGGPSVEVLIDPDLPPLNPDEELVVYRVAQESLTNVMRHASAESAKVRLQGTEGGVTLSVTDDGCGLNGAASGRSGGIRGMRERAVLIGASLSVESRSARGVEVRLEIPRRPP